MATNHERENKRKTSEEGLMMLNIHEGIAFLGTSSRSIQKDSIGDEEFGFIGYYHFIPSTNPKALSEELRESIKEALVEGAGLRIDEDRIDDSRDKETHGKTRKLKGNNPTIVVFKPFTHNPQNESDLKSGVNYRYSDDPIPEQNRFGAISVKNSLRTPEDVEKAVDTVIHEILGLLKQSPKYSTVPQQLQQ